jgi:pimeloyl-ACP methyl ester carboxylesterase
VARLAVAANGLVFEATTAGPAGGRTVLLLHGYPQTSACWHHQLGALSAAGYRAVAFDQRGYSPHARPAEVADYHVDHLVTDVLAVADALGSERFDLVGHDWGAMVAWLVAARHPGRVRTLSAVSVPHPAAFGRALASSADQGERSSYIGVYRQPGKAERALLGEDGRGGGLRKMFATTGLAPDAPIVDVFVAAMTEPGALTAALNWYRAMDPGSVAGIGPVTVPTLYVWSTEDDAIGRTAAESNAEWVSGPYRFVVLDGVSHWIPETAADDLSRALLEHLDSEGGDVTDGAP